MPEAFRLHSENPEYFNEERFNTFKNFLTTQLNIPEEKLPEVELEDIFTPLDRCLSENCQFRGISLDNILKVRESVFYVVGKTIQLILNQTKNSKQYINEFAEHITNLSSCRSNSSYKREDPVSVISTNWDILLDNSIYNYITSKPYNAVVDYCCYISSKDKTDESVKPGLEKLGQGGFNVKQLKLHGSLNWLQCTRCMRLYAQFNQKDAIRNFEIKSSCRHCDNNFPEEFGRHLLASNLIMPTYIKDLTNPQYKIIWQNAGIEISEADKLVFIGYSLPNADFEMRQLLSRMTRKKAEIEVVDYCDEHGENRIKTHWERFFGNRRIAFHFKGAKAYIEHLTNTKSAPHI